MRNTEHYELVAFYREIPAEAAAAVQVAEAYRLQLRYEKVPETPAVVRTLLHENTVLCFWPRPAWPFRRLLKYVYALDRPVWIAAGEKEGEAARHLKVPVGYLPENKEKAMWINFFCRARSACRVELVVPQEKDRGIADQVADNLEFVERVFEKAGTAYTRTYTGTGFEKSVAAVFQQTGDAVVVLMRPFRLFSFQLPLIFRLFRKYGGTSALVIPRDENLYVPCH